MRMRDLAAVFAVVLLASSSALALNTGAASPDGKTFVVGGTNRAIYVYDTTSWEIAKRMWIGARVEQIQFTPDGSQCVILGDDKVARIYAANAWTKVRELAGASAFAMAQNAPVAVTAERKKGGGYRDYVVQAWSIPTWQPTAVVALPKGGTPAALAITADGKTAYVRSGSTNEPKEKTVDPGPEPKDYTEKSLWRMRKDGRVSSISIVDVAGGSLKKTVACFDTPGRCRLFPVANGVVTVAYNRYAAILDATSGDYKTVPTKQFAYGSGQSLSGQLYLGSLRSFVILSPALARVGAGRISSLPGWPEYFRGFAPLGQNLVVGVTDSFRIIVINAANHTVVRQINCY